MLKDIVDESREVSWGKNKVNIYALSTNDFAVLFNRHTKDMGHFLDAISDLKDNDDQAGANFIEGMPELMASVIAQAAREPDEVAAVRLMPIPVQCECFNHAWELTFPREEKSEQEHVKKCITAIAQILGMVNIMSSSSETS